VTAVLGLMCLVWAVAEAFEGRITVSSDPNSIQDEYPCGNVMSHRPACDASVYTGGTVTAIVAAVLAVALLACSAVVIVRVSRRPHSVAAPVE